jgi:exopolysaccharide production protein ExoQ
LEPAEPQDLFRLGEGATNANSLGLTAVMAFCMSLGRSSGHRIRWFILQSLFVTTVVLTRSRVALIALLLGFIVHLWFKQRLSTGIRSYLPLAAIPCFLASMAALAVVVWTMQLPVVSAAVDFVNRGEDSSEVMSVTGRTDIWPYAIERISEGSTSFVFGHGYGASREVLNENNWRASFFAHHSHNTILELLLSTGVLGTLPFLLLIAFSLTWFLRFFESCKAFSPEFTLRAIACITAIFSSTMTESDLATKVGPILIVFLFYALALDRRRMYAT